MSDSHRIDDLRRRVQKDPSSIAFAQLAEECRRAGEFQEAVNVCRAGLELHPGYLSARVTLGRALAELNEVDAAQAELETVLKGAPDNLAAVRGLAEILHRRGLLAEALAQYRTALSLSRSDQELERIIGDVSREVGSSKKPSGPSTSSTSSTSSAGSAPASLGPAATSAGPTVGVRIDGATDVKVRTLAALEQLVNAIHVARAGRRA
ncbi:MAG: tetratricopeptide repeat protein [Vicinamibacterales bacterium]